LVHGEVTFDAATFEDLVLIKSNGFAAYNFACVVDDHDTHISHVIRGDDHLSNTPRQILIYEALGWQPPAFAHLPLVVAKNGTPLSKRDAVVDLGAYRDAGFVPDAILNYLALLGWSAGANREFYPRQELIAAFSVDRVHHTSAMFDPAKLRWLNGEHLKALSDEEFVSRGLDYLTPRTSWFEAAERSFAANVLLLYKGRAATWQELAEQAAYFFVDQPSYDPDGLRSYAASAHVREELMGLTEILSLLGGFNDEQAIERALREEANRRKIEARALIHPTRFAVSGRAVTPSLFAVMRVLGKERTLARLRNFTRVLNERAMPA
jgi:glutamyl-tRNA synthetase